MPRCNDMMVHDVLTLCHDVAWCHISWQRKSTMATLVTLTFDLRPWPSKLPTCYPNTSSNQISSLCLKWFSYKSTDRLPTDTWDRFYPLNLWRQGAGELLGDRDLSVKPGLEFTKKICFSFRKVGQKFTSPNKFKLFRIILATYE